MMEAETNETMEGARKVEGKDDGNIGVGIDPFVQPPILKALFDQLPVEDLARCRLVSKLWYNESLSTWRSNSTIKLREGRKIFPAGEDDSRRTTSLAEFLDLWDAGDWSSCPFKQFKLDWWNFEGVEQQRFLELVGGHITSLTLNFCSFVGREDFRRIMFQAFPKLQFLKMDHCEVRGAFYWDQYPPRGVILAYTEPAFGVHGLKSLSILRALPHSMMDILSHFHKVKHLRMPSHSSDLQEYRNLLETIRLIRAEDKTKLPLTNFDVEFKFGLEMRQSNPQLCLLSLEIVELHDRLKLPLERLNIFGYSENKNLTRDVLQNHFSTLKHLGLWNKEHEYFCKSFPSGLYFGKLEELSLKSRFSGNLNFLRCTPNLRVLKITDVTPISISQSDNLFSNSTQLEIGDWNLPSLTQLTFWTSFPLSVCNLRKLIRWMPNVDYLLGLELDDVKLALVCKHWKNLKYLDARGTELTDEGILGRDNDPEVGDDEETQSGPRISQLTNLTTFKTDSSKLTSASVHDGFLKLANLNWLSLGYTSKIDDEAKAALERRRIEFRI